MIFSKDKLLLLLLLYSSGYRFSSSFVLFPSTIYLQPASHFERCANNFGQSTTFVSEGRATQRSKVNLTHKSVEDSASRKKSSNLQESTCRRLFLSKVLISSSVTASCLSIDVKPSNAGEVGTRINRAVTQSDLGISVRRSVVQGARVIDDLDGKWEKFSDENNLGKERSKRDARPEPKDIPEPLPLNVDVARNVLKVSDETFLSMLPPGTDLQGQIDKLDRLVRKSFEIPESNAMSAYEFNYYSYIHFRAFCKIMVDSNMPIDRKKFENELGERLLPIFLPNQKYTMTNSNLKKEQAMKQGIENGLALTDQICRNLKSFGFVSLADRSEIENERISDWTEDLSDLKLVIPLDKDITINAQSLLQEQGYRVYPDFGRFVITTALQRSLQGLNQVVISDEYYMDTNYSSDPKLFEVKQVLVNIVIDSP